MSARASIVVGSLLLVVSLAGTAGSAPISVTLTAPLATSANGGRGNDADLQDAVSGSDPNTLYLLQETIASGGLTGAPGGNATSRLHASNPGGGDVYATAKASGGRGSPGGHALATTDVTGAPGRNASAVSEANILCCGGATNFSTVPAGDGTALATATGNGEVHAYSLASAGFAKTSVASADSRSEGTLLGTSAALTVSTTGTAGSTPTGNTALAATGIRGNPIFQQTEVFANVKNPVASGQLFADPDAYALASTSFFYNSPTVLDAWTDENGDPRLRLLAAGAIGGAIDAPQFGGPASQRIAAHGSLSLDLSSGDFHGGAPLTFAFVDFANSGSGNLVLDLQLSHDGEIVLTRSYVNVADALGGLHDNLVSLGDIAGAGPSTTWTLAWDLAMDQGPSFHQVAATFAFFAPVPEPPSSALCAFGLALAFGAHLRLRATEVS